MNKILIVEDEIEVLDTCKTKLEHAGFEVLTAKDGQEGLQNALTNHPDLLLLDINIPKIDGMTLMKKIRESPWGVKVPIIFLTNMEPDDAIIQVIMNANLSYYLIKANTSMDEVVEKVKEVLHVS